MPRPMRRYKVETGKAPEHSFEYHSRQDAFVYNKFGSVATYSNKTQADKKVEQLRSLGYNCGRTFNHPFLIILLPEQ